jgi:hypothetical protein
MAFIRVAYKTKKAGFDYVDGNLLETLIIQDEIRHFFRPSDKRWVSAKFDAVREGRKDGYQAPSGGKIRNTSDRRFKKKENRFQIQRETAQIGSKAYGSALKVINIIRPYMNPILHAFTKEFKFFRFALFFKLLRILYHPADFISIPYCTHNVLGCSGVPNDKEIGHLTP